MTSTTQSSIPLATFTASYFRKWIKGMSKSFGIYDAAMAEKINTCRTDGDARRLIKALATSPLLVKLHRLEGYSMRIFYSLGAGADNKVVTSVRVSFGLVGKGSQRPDFQGIFATDGKMVGLTLPGGTIVHGSKEKHSCYDKNDFADEVKGFPPALGKTLLMFYRQMLTGFNLLKGGNNTQPVWQKMMDEVRVLQNPLCGRLSPEMLPNLPGFFRVVDDIYGGAALPGGPLAERYASIRHLVEGRSTITAGDLYGMMFLEEELKDVFALQTEGGEVTGLGARVLIYKNSTPENELSDMLIFMVENGYGAGTCALVYNRHFHVSTTSNVNKNQHFNPSGFRRVCGGTENAKRVATALVAISAYLQHDRQAHAKCREVARFLMLNAPRRMTC